MSKKDKTLRKVLRNYDRDKELSRDYVQLIGYSIGRFESFLGRKAKVSDLKHKTVNRWMQHELMNTDLAAKTRSNGLSHVITLWKYVGRKFDRSRIRRVKVPAKNPAAWYESEIETVAHAMSQLPGRLKNGVPRSLYFKTILWFAFETGLRRRDIWNFETKWFNGRRATLTQNKTGKVHIVKISDRTFSDLIAIDRVLVSRESEHVATPLRWPQSQSQFYYWFRKARAIAGVDANVVNRVIQHLRRSGATAVTMDGDEAYRYLGHTKPGLDRISYVDQIKTARAISPKSCQSRDMPLRIAT